MARRKEGFFWASYTDLMTTLFFVMLVLYALTWAVLKQTIVADANKYQKIKEVEDSVKKLQNDEDKYFSYDAKYKRLILTDQIQFERASSIIPEDERQSLLEVGQKINTVLQKQHETDSTNNMTLLVIIEGMASKEGETDDNYYLSYQRAYSLFKLWDRTNTIDMQNEKNEILVVGSGEGGVGRYTKASEEKKNRRFIIQIIPKIDAL